MGPDVSVRFGVDVVFAPEVLANQDLIQLEAPAAGLDAVQTALAGQLKASITFVDGVLWAAPAAEAATQPASGPALDAGNLLPAPDAGEAATSPEAPAPEAPPPRDADDVWGRPVRIQRSVREWPRLARQLGAAAGVDCRIDAAGAAAPSVEAEGPLATVLEAARILEGWSWTLTPAEPGKAPVLLLRTAPARPPGG